MVAYDHAMAPELSSSILKKSAALEPHSAHFVRFFGEQFPADDIAAFLAASLARDGAAFCVATAEHTRAIQSSLRDLLGPAGAEENVVFIDADVAVRLVAPHGLVSATRFRELVTDALDLLLTRHPLVHAYGEAVGLLCADGMASAAMVIESLWSELVLTRRVRVMCGYSAGSFREGGEPDTFDGVCRAHDDALGHDAGGKPFEIDRDDAISSLTARLIVLQHVTSALSEALTPADVARVVLKTVSAQVNARHAAVVVPSPEHGRLVFLGGTSAAVHSLAEVAHDDPLAQAFFKQAPVLTTTQHDGAEHVFVALPLHVGRDTIGVVGFAFGADCTVHGSTVSLLTAVATQTALALDRSRLYEEAEHSRRRLRTLVRAATQISAAKLDLQTILAAVVQTLIGSIADGAGIFLRAEEDEAIELGYFDDIDEEVARSVQEACAQHPVELGKGLIGRIIATGTPVLAPRIDESAFSNEHPVHARIARGRPDPIASVLGVPIRTSTKVIGALIAARGTRGEPFTKADQDLLTELADRASVSIESATLYASAQRERERAEEASLAKDEFLAMLGHELRNPLSPILTALELMKIREDAVGEHHGRERGVIERQVRSMMRLVDDLLDVSRIARGKIKLTHQRVDLATIVTKAVEMASPLLEQRGHHLTIAVPKGLYLEVDEARVTQVVTNLLVNAGKYTADGGHIAIRGDREGDTIALRVIDDGEGIASDLLPRVFDLFVQGERGLDRSSGGLGIGLAVARSIVEGHGGSIACFSDGPGMGTEFVVQLAAGPDVATIPPPADTSPRGLTCDGKRVLVVDDNPEAADALADALRECGHDALVAYDGPSALDKLATFNPDVAVLDIGLPAMDGYELAGRLHEREPELRLIAMTGYGQESDRLRARAAGFSTHLVKPVPLSTVLGAIEVLTFR